jgi:hypothetical protein
MGVGLDKRRKDGLFSFLSREEDVTLVIYDPG